MAVDAKKWLETKLSNLSDEEKVAAEKLFSNPAIVSGFNEFVPQSDFNSQLDRQRNQYTQQVQELTNYNLQWQQSYENEWKPKLTLADKLLAAGLNPDEFVPDNNGGAQNRNNGQSVTPDQLKQLTDNIEQMRTGLLEFATFIPDKAFEYREAYGKKLNVSEFRDFASKNHQQYVSLEQAFDAYTAADRAAKEEKDKKDYEERTRKEIEQQLRSEMQIPVQPGSSGNGSPFYAVRNTTANSSGNTPADNRAEFAKKFATQDFNITI